VRVSQDHASAEQGLWLSRGASDRTLEKEIRMGSSSAPLSTPEGPGSVSRRARLTARDHQRSLRAAVTLSANAKAPGIILAQQAPTGRAG
jgi:hypothetical protein